MNSSFVWGREVCYNDGKGSAGRNMVDGAGRRNHALGGVSAVKKKLLCLVLALCLCAAAALAGNGTFALRFDEGFTLSLPEGWVRYPAAGDGPIRYALGPGEGGRYLYILVQDADLDGIDALRAAIEAAGDFGKTSSLELNGADFAAFIAPALNASGVATLHNGRLITFLFTPQDDSDFMLVAAEIMASIQF